MLQPITKDNFYQLLRQYTTSDLEDMVKRYPYLHEAHILLAKRYYLENNPNYQLQIEKAAAYTKDRPLFYELFSNDTSSSWPGVEDWDIAVSLHDELYSGETEVASLSQDAVTEDILISIPSQDAISDVPPLIEETVADENGTTQVIPPVIDEAVETLLSQTVEQEITPENFATVIEEPSTVIVDSTEKINEVRTEESVPPITEDVEIIEGQIETTEPEEELTPQTTAEEQKKVAGDEPDAFLLEQPHTFSEWLKAFAPELKDSVTENEPIQKQEEEPREDELERGIQENISSDYVHELVEEQIHQTKGLEEYIKEQIGKRKKPVFHAVLNENDLDPTFVTETMAGVYEMQKKYAKAIRAYELLTLKYPEKNDLFAARINYLKNII